MNEPRNLSAPGVQPDARDSGRLAVAAGTTEAVPLDGVGLLRTDRFLELRWATSAVGIATVDVVETGQRGEAFSWSFQLGPSGAHRIQLSAGLAVSVTAVGDPGILHFRALDDVDPKRAPPVQVSELLPPLGAGAPWTALGWVPPYRTDVAVYPGGAGVEVAWFDRAGVQLAPCPTNEIVIHPPHAQLRARNTNAPATPDFYVLAVWR